MNRRAALWRLCQAIFGPRSNLIGTDFADVQLWVVERKFPQDANGVVIQFAISNHALEKVIATQESADALECLLASTREVDR